MHFEVSFLLDNRVLVYMLQVAITYPTLSRQYKQKLKHKNAITVKEWCFVGRDSVP